jgi:hypothetical protein
VAKASGKPSEFAENPLIAELIAAGAENSRLMRGFIGPSSDDRYITLYPRLARLGNSVQIPIEDILHRVDAPGSGLGAVMVWVKEDSQTFLRSPQPTREVIRGRLRMKLRPNPSPNPGIACVPCDPCEPTCGPPCDIEPLCTTQ